MYKWIDVEVSNVPRLVEQINARGLDLEKAIGEYGSFSWNMVYPNDVWLRWWNVAGDDTINVLKVNTSDDTVLSHTESQKISFEKDDEEFFNCGLPTAPGSGPWLELIAKDDDNDTWTAMGMTEYGLGSCYLWFWTMAGTQSSPAATPADRPLGWLEFGGWAPTLGLSAVGASIVVRAAATWTATSTPAQIEFHTCPVNDTEYYIRLLIEPTGEVIVSDEDPLTTWWAEFKVENSALITRSTTGWCGLALVHQDDSDQQGVGLEVYSCNDYTLNAPYVVMSRAGGTWGSKSAIVSGTRLGVLSFTGWTGSAWIAGVEIVAVAPAAWTHGSSTPAQIEVYTTPIGDTGKELAMVIYDDKDVYIGGGLEWGQVGGTQIASSNDVLATPYSLTGAGYADTIEMKSETTYYFQRLRTWSTSTYYPVIELGRAGGTEGTPLAIGVSQTLGQLRFIGYDGAIWTTGATIEAFTGTAWDDSPAEHSTYLVFSTRSTGTITAWWRITPAGAFAPDTAYGVDIGAYAVPVDDVFAKRLHIHTNSTTQEAIKIEREASGAGFIAIYSSTPALLWEVGCTATGDDNYRYKDGTYTVIDMARAGAMTIKPGGNLTLDSQTGVLYVGADLLPDADSSLDLGATSAVFAQGWFDSIRSDGDITFYRGGGLKATIGASLVDFDIAVNVDGQMQCDTLRIDQSPTSGTGTESHRFSIDLNGSTYWVNCFEYPS